MPDQKNSPKNFLQYSSLGFQMLGFMAIFGFIGHKLDVFFAFKKPILTVLGLAFGVTASMIYLIRTLNKNND
ncbi:MAG: AtpZ/AtpI family protein [Flavobacteriia bacterium]|nr:AtpZ/AtpI family protein [Flavobacteriia bacterium]NBX38935.1 AtpZ/AtpI family protein [Flavobacteriia bacterium]